MVKRYDERTGEYYTPDTDGGLTKREYFAAMAMQGLIAGIPIVVRSGKTPQAATDGMADAAVLSADALIATLNEGKT